MARAELIREKNPHTGKDRDRCTACGKIAFQTRGEAEAAASRIQGSRGARMEAYEGMIRGGGREVPCGWWHLTMAKEEPTASRTNEKS